MKYFTLNQDDRYDYPINPKIDKSKKFSNLDDTNVLYVSENNKNDYLDFLENPALFCSDKLKELLEAYNEEIKFKAAAMTDMKNEMQELYWFIDIPKVECLSDKIDKRFYSGLNKIILCEKKIQGNKIFLIKEIFRNQIVVNLQVAESMLRRNFKGIILKELEVEQI